MTHICSRKLTNIRSDNGLSPGRRQAIIWTNAGILLIGPLETNFSEILIKIQTFSFNKMHLKMSSAKWHPFCLWPQCVKAAVWWQLIAFEWLRILLTHQWPPHDGNVDGSSSLALHCLGELNSSDARDRKFQLIGPIICLLMSWLLKLPEHQQSSYWHYGSSSLALHCLGELTVKCLI